MTSSDSLQSVARQALFAGAKPFFVALLVSFVPVLAATAYLWIFHRSVIFDLIPSHPNDAVDYWHEAFSVAVTGLRTGYYGYQETHAPVLGFGSHSVWYPALLGYVGRLTGWTWYSIPLFQSVALTAACLFFIIKSRLSGFQMAFLTAFLLTYPVMMVYTNLSMQETLHFSLCFILAYYAHKLTAEAMTLGQGFRIGTIACLFWTVIFACVMRITWIFMLVPLLVLVTPKKKYAILAAISFFVAVFAFLNYVAFYLFRAPYPFTSCYSDAIDKVVGGYVPQNVLSSLVENLRRVLVMFGSDATSSRTLMLYQLLFLVVMVLICSFCCAQGGNRKRGFLHVIFPVSLVILTMMSLLAFCIVEDMNRIIAPVFLFCVLFALLYKPNRYLFLLVVINVAILPPYLLSFSGEALGVDTSGQTRARIEKFRNEVKGVITFQPGASPWENTVATYDIGPEILGLPPGIAYNYIRDVSSVDMPLKSRYVILPPNIDPLVRSRFGKLEFVARNDFGDLYLNDAFLNDVNLAPSNNPSKQLN